MDHYIQRLRNKHVTICPCCGFKFEGSLSVGCESCGARAVGEPLPKPEHELPSYLRSLLLAITGSLMVLIFLTETVLALAKRTPLSFGFWSWIAAGETAAWRLKWVAMPVSLVVLWASRKLYRSLIETPERFCGLRYAKLGLLASSMVPVLIATLIGVTVPERLRQRQSGIEAGYRAQGYAIDRALIQYREQFGTLPSDLNDLSRLPDADGSIAAALKNLDATDYKTSADVATVLPKRKPRPTVIKASLASANDVTLTEGLSFTNYELRLAGPDKIRGTEDDLIVRDGIISNVGEVSKQLVTTTASSKVTKP